VRKVPESHRKETSRRSGARLPSARIGGSLPSDRSIILSVIMPIVIRFLICEPQAGGEDVHIYDKGVK
jgi:hypothetical protein